MDFYIDPPLSIGETTKIYKQKSLEQKICIFYGIFFDGSHGVGLVAILDPM